MDRSQILKYMGTPGFDLLAVQSCLCSLQGVWILLLQSMGAFPGTWSDATNMAQMTGIPAMFWGVWWALFSVGMLRLDHVDDVQGRSAGKTGEGM